MKVVTPAQMAALEAASQRRGVSTDALMENAGLAVAQTVRRLLGGVADAAVVVLVGPGNNGSDGLVTARHLRRWGARVTAYLLAGRPTEDPKMDMARDYDVEVVSLADDPGMYRLEELLRRSRVVVDAVLGTGRARPLQGGVKEALLRLQACRSGLNRPQIVALDLPTGLNADSGEVDPACPQADVTVALGRPKAGLLAFPGAAMAGRLEVADIGIPPDLEEEEDIALELLTAPWVGTAPAVQALGRAQRLLWPCFGSGGVEKLRGRSLPRFPRCRKGWRGSGHPGVPRRRVPDRRRQADRGYPPSTARR